MLVALELLLIWLSDSLPGPETCGLLGEVSCPSCCWETCFNCRKQQSPFCAEVSGTRHCRWPTFGEPPLWFALLEETVYCSYWNKKIFVCFQDGDDQKREYEKKLKQKYQEIFLCYAVTEADRRPGCTPKPELVCAKVNPKVNSRPGSASCSKEIVGVANMSMNEHKVLNSALARCLVKGDFRYTLDK